MTDLDVLIYVLNVICRNCLCFFVSVGDLLPKWGWFRRSVGDVIEGERGGELLLRAPESKAWTEKRGRPATQNKRGHIRARVSTTLCTGLYPRQNPTHSSKTMTRLCRFQQKKGEGRQKKDVV